MKLLTSTLDPAQLGKRDLMTIVEQIVDEVVKLHGKDLPPSLQGRYDNLVHDLQVIDQRMGEINDNGGEYLIK